MCRLTMAPHLAPCRAVLAASRAVALVGSFELLMLLIRSAHQPGPQRLCEAAAGLPVPVARQGVPPAGADGLGVTRGCWRRGPSRRCPPSSTQTRTDTTTSPPETRHHWPIRTNPLYRPIRKIYHSIWERPLASRSHSAHLAVPALRAKHRSRHYTLSRHNAIILSTGILQVNVPLDSSCARSNTEISERLKADVLFRVSLVRG